MTDPEKTGHRQRLRERFAKSRFDGFHDYEVLEMLLFAVFREGDVKPLAKLLITTFGSFSQVLDAPIEELLKVKGVGPATALHLSALRETIAFYHRSNVFVNPIQITKMSGLVEMLRASIGHRSNEVLFAIYLNAKNEVLATIELGEGTVSQASAFPRKIAEEALRVKATSLILAHNHPGGVAEPSEQDIAITAEIQKAMALLGITLQDHIILASKEYFSFNRNQLI